MRHAGPCVAEDVRNLQGGRVTTAGRYAGGVVLVGVSGVSRSSGLITARIILVATWGIQRGRLELSVPEQHLDQADVDVLFEQVSGKAVPEGVRCHPLVDPGDRRGDMNRAIKLPRRVRGMGITAREQPDLRASDAIPVAQEFEQLWGEHGKAILAAFALLDA